MAQRINVSGARGESFADVARRVGDIAGIPVPPETTDSEALELLADAAGVNSDVTDAVAEAENARDEALAARDSQLAYPALWPNLFPDSDFIDLTARPSNPTVWVGTGTLSQVDTAFGHGVLLEAGARYVNIPRERFGDTLYAAVAINSYERVSGTVRVFIQQMNVGGTEIDSSTNRLTLFSTTTTGEVVTPQTVSGSKAIHADCTVLRVNFDAGTGAGSYLLLDQVSLSAGGGAHLLKPPVAGGLIHVNEDTGSNENSGGADAPVATLDAAIARLTTADRRVSGTIVLHNEWMVAAHIPLGNSNNGGQAYADGLRIMAAGNVRVKFLHGTLLASITKTGGQTNVYQVAYTGAPQAPFLFEHLTPESEILLADRRPQHRGWTHRCPSTRMRQATSLANCDATPGTWWYASDVLYFHPFGSTDPTTSGLEYYMPAKLASTRNGGVGYGVRGKTGHVEISGIEVWYGYHGIDLGGCGSFVIEDCGAIGCTTNGIMTGGTTTTGGFGNGVARRNYAVGNGNDGMGWSESNADESTDYRNASLVDDDPYCALNFDSGYSTHWRISGSGRAGLFELNDDEGWSVAVGAEFIWSDGEALNNGQGTSGITGEGFAVRGDPTAAEDGVGTVARLVNPRSVGNKINFNVSGTATSRMYVMNGISRDAVTYGYATGVASALILQGRCTSDGDAVSTTGTLVVEGAGTPVT